MKKTLLLAALATLFIGCGEDSEETPQTKANLLTGTNDNAEIIRAIPGTNDAILISSKAKTISRYTYDEKKGILFKAVSDAISTSDDNETTSGTLLDNDTILVTHTLLNKTNDKITACNGELVALSLKDGEFGKELKRIAVGSMPDAVGISPNKKWAITADEHDSGESWGKCEQEVATEKPSVTIVDLQNGAANMKAVARIWFDGRSKDGAREPEYVSIASDNDTVAVSLQDSNEIAIFSISEIMKNEPAESGLIEIQESEVNIQPLPYQKELYTWPDGVVSIDVNGATYFVLAGEWNDTIVTVDTNGKVISTYVIKESDVPTNYPCNINAEEPEPLYSPDSLATFKRNDHQYVAASLRYAGAILVLNFDDPANPKFAGIEKVGLKDTGSCQEGKSKVRPEGISATADLIWTANEKESSLSVVRTDSIIVE